MKTATLNGTSASHPLSGRLREHQERKADDSKDQSLEENAGKKSVFWMQQRNCIHELTTSVAACPRPAQNQVSQHSSKDQGGAHEAQHLI